MNLFNTKQTSTSLGRSRHLILMM